MTFARLVSELINCIAPYNQHALLHTYLRAEAHRLLSNNDPESKRIRALHALPKASKRPRGGERQLLYVHKQSTKDVL